VPLDFDAPISSEWNNNYILERLHGHDQWPDQQAIDMVYQAMPFVPMRVTPQGLVEQHGKCRRTADMGAPRKDVADQGGVAAISINKAINLRGSLKQAAKVAAIGAGRQLARYAGAAIGHASGRVVDTAFRLPQGALASAGERVGRRIGESLSQAIEQRLSTTSTVLYFPEDDSGVSFALDLEDGGPQIDGCDGESEDEASTGSGSNEEGTSSAPKWTAPETKPRPECVAYDGAILRHAAEIWQEPLLGGTDDIKGYFTQLPVHSSELWKNTIAWQLKNNAVSAPVDQIVELRLGFGMSLSPNIAQRWSHAIMHMLKLDFDAEELPRFEDMLSDGQVSDDAKAWIRSRRRLSALTGNQELRLYTAHMYTDDSVFLVVGVARAARLWQCWHSLTSNLNMRMASASKRQFGTRFTWLGFSFYTQLGIVGVQPSKRDKALHTIQRLIDPNDEVTFDDYRRLVGLLQHLMLMVGGDQTYMAFMYGANFARGIALGPATVVQVDGKLGNQLRRWRDLLVTQAGASFMEALLSRTVVVPKHPDIDAHISASSLLTAQPAIDRPRFLFSDAAAETEGGGMGGYSGGFYWSWLFTDGQLQDLHITALEFIAFGVNLIMFSDVTEDRRIVCGVDALASVQAMQNWAHSENMQIIQQQIFELAEYDKVRPFLKTQHLYGEANIVADAASRGKDHILTSLGKALGIPMIRLPISDRARTFVSAVCRELRLANVAKVTSRAQQDRMRRAGSGYSSDITGDGPDSNFGIWFRRPNGSSKEPFPPFTGDCTPTKQPATQAAAFGITFTARTPVAASRSTGVQKPGTPPAPRERGQAATASFGIKFNGSKRRLDLEPRSRLGKLPALPSGHKLLHAVAVGAMDAPPATPFSDRGGSLMAIRPTGAYARGLAAAVEYGLNTARPAASATKEARAWKLWLQFCALMGTAPIRDDVIDQAVIVEEMKLVFCFFIHLIVELKPRDKTRRLIKPKTALDHVFYVQRIMRRQHHRTFNYLAQVKVILERATLDFCLLDGMESLSQKRREPVTDLEKRSMLKTPNGTKISSRLVKALIWQSCFGINFKAAILVCANTGFRKDEIVGPFTSLKMSRANLFWIIDGKIQRNPSAEALKKEKGKTNREGRRCWVPDLSRPFSSSFALRLSLSLFSISLSARLPSAEGGVAWRPRSRSL
jgi:hypothetical protein